MVDLPEPDRPVNHSTTGLWPFSVSRSARLISSGLRVDVGRAAQAELDHAGADRGVGVAVDQDEGAGVAVVRVGVEGDRCSTVDRLQKPISFSASVLRGQVLERVDVDLVLEAGDLGRHGLGADAHQVGAAGKQRLLGHPQHVGGELVGHLRPVRGADQHVAARDIDLVGQVRR